MHFFLDLGSHIKQFLGHFAELFALGSQPCYVVIAAYKAHAELMLKRLNGARHR